MISTIIRLSVCGFRSSEFVPVLPVDSTVEGLAWMTKETAWSAYAKRKVVEECLHHRDEDGVEYEQFDEGGPVFVFNRVFPGSLQTFTPEGVEKDATKCDVCGASPAGEMYQGPNLCSRCFEVVRERMKGEKELAMGGMLTLTADKAREMCRGSEPRNEGEPDSIPDLPRILSLADRVMPGTSSVVGVLDRMEAGELSSEDAVSVLMEDATAAIRAKTTPVTPKEAVERWFKECAEAFGYPSVRAMPHGVLYEGDKEKVVVSFDQLLTPEAERLVLDANAAQEAITKKAFPPGFAPRGLIPPDRFEKDSFRTIHVLGERVVVGTVKAPAPSPATDLWRKVNDAVKEMDGEAVEEALSLRMEGDPSGLGKEIDVLLSQIESFGEILPEDAGEARANLIAEKWVVQKVIFPVGKYTVESAQAWMREHNYNILKTTTKDRYIHIRSNPPKKGAGSGDYGFLPMGDTGIKVLRMRQSESVRVYDDPADYDRVLREAGLHELAKGSDKVAPLGPRSWVLGYPDGSSRLLLYFPRRGIAKLYEKEFAVFSFDPAVIDKKGRDAYTLANYKKQHGADEVPWTTILIHDAARCERAANNLLNELRRIKQTNSDTWEKLFASTSYAVFERNWRDLLRGGKRGPDKEHQVGGASHDSWVTSAGEDVPVDLFLTRKEDRNDIRKKVARARPDLDQLETSDILLMLSPGVGKEQGRFDVYVIRPESVTISPKEKGGSRRGTRKVSTRWAYGNVSQMKWMGVIPESVLKDPPFPIHDMRGPFVGSNNLSEQAGKEGNPFKDVTKTELLHAPKRGETIPEGYWGWRLPSGAFIAVNMHEQVYHSAVQALPYDRIMRWIFVQGVNTGIVTGGIPRDNDATFKRGAVFFSVGGGIASISGTSPNFDAIYATIKALPIRKGSTLEIGIVDKGVKYTGVPTGFDEWVWGHFPAMKPAHIPTEKTVKDEEPEVEVKVPPEPRPVKSMVYNPEDYDPFRKPPATPVKKAMGQGLSFDIGHGRGEYREVVWRELWHAGKTSEEGPKLVDAIAYRSDDGVYTVHGIWKTFKDSKRPEHVSFADYTLQSWNNLYLPFLHKEGYSLAIEEHPSVRDIKGQFRKIVSRPAGEGIRVEELPRGSYGIRWIGPVKGEKGFWAGTIKKAPESDLLGKSFVVRWASYPDIRRPQVGKEYDFHVIHMPSAGYVQTLIFTESLLSEALAPEEETLDDTFDNIVRKLSITGSIDALQDVEFDENNGSILLFFSATMPREEADELTQILSRYYVNTRLIGSPDHSLADEQGDSEWWVIHVPSRREPAPTPAPEKGFTPQSTPQNNRQFTGKDAIGAVIKGVDVDKAVDALVKGESIEVYFTGVVSLTEGGVEELFVQPLNKEHPEWKGGLITFSTDVNATAQPGLYGKLKSWFSTLLNRFSYSKRLRELMAMVGKNFGYTVRPSGRGVYVSADGHVFNEKSLSIEILGIPNDFLHVVGAALAKEFHQEAVLLRYYDTNAAMTVSDKQPPPRESDPLSANLAEDGLAVVSEFLGGLLKHGLPDPAKARVFVYKYTPVPTDRFGKERDPMFWAKEAVKEIKEKAPHVLIGLHGDLLSVFYSDTSSAEKAAIQNAIKRSGGRLDHVEDGSGRRLTGESEDGLAVEEFNPATFAQAFASRVNGELVMAPKGLSSGIVEVVVGDRRVRFTAPGLGGGVNVMLLHKEKGIHSLGHFAALDVEALTAKIEENSGPFGASPA